MTRYALALAGLARVAGVATASASLRALAAPTASFGQPARTLRRPESGAERGAGGVRASGAAPGQALIHGPERYRITGGTSVLRYARIMITRLRGAVASLGALGPPDRRLFSVVIGAGAVAAMLAFAVCSAEASPETRHDTITITMLANFNKQPGYDVLIPNFERVYPNIKVNITYAAARRISRGSS